MQRSYSSKVGLPLLALVFLLAGPYQCTSTKHGCDNQQSKSGRKHRAAQSQLLGTETSVVGGNGGATVPGTVTIKTQAYFHNGPESTEPENAEDAMQDFDGAVAKICMQSKETLDKETGSYCVRLVTGTDPKTGESGVLVDGEIVLRVDPITGEPTGEVAGFVKNGSYSFPVSAFFKDGEKAALCKEVSMAGEIVYPVEEMVAQFGMEKYGQYGLTEGDLRAFIGDAHVASLHNASLDVIVKGHPIPVNVFTPGDEPEKIDIIDPCSGNRGKLTIGASQVEELTNGALCYPTLHEQAGQPFNGEIAVGYRKITNEVTDGVDENGNPVVLVPQYTAQVIVFINDKLNSTDGNGVDNWIRADICPREPGQPDLFDLSALSNLGVSTDGAEPWVFSENGWDRSSGDISFNEDGSMVFSTSEATGINFDAKVAEPACVSGDFSVLNRRNYIPQQ